MSPKDPSQQGWQPLKSIQEAAFVHARQQCHWAMQILASVGYAHLERAQDDSQSNAGWVDGMQILAGRMVEGDHPFFVSLSLARLSVAVHEPGGEVLEEFHLHGRSLREAFDALAAAIGRRCHTDPIRLELPNYEMAGHALATDGRFDFGDAKAFSALADWMHDGNLVMLDLRKNTEGATVPRVWPHHFDMGMLISLENDGDAQQGRSIGIGLSPGDTAISMPYWYTNPYPQPDPGVDLPELAEGHWHREGWTGAVLDTSEVVAHRESSAQESQARAYLDTAVLACRKLLE